MKPLFFATLGAMLLSVSAAHAEVLAAWDVNGVKTTDFLSPSYDYNASFPPARIDSSVMSLGVGAASNPSNGANEYGFRINTGLTSLSDAITANEYLQFTISAQPDWVMNLDTVVFNSIDTGVNGHDNYALMSNIDGFTDGEEIATGTTFGAEVTIDVSGLGPQTDVVFRLYAWGGTTASHQFRITDDNNAGADLIINGSLVPEVQSALPLASLLGFAVIGLRRRKLR